MTIPYIPRKRQSSFIFLPPSSSLLPPLLLSSLLLLITIQGARQTTRRINYYYSSLIDLFCLFFTAPLISLYTNSPPHTTNIPFWSPACKRIYDLSQKGKKKKVKKARSVSAERISIDLAANRSSCLSLFFSFLLAHSPPSLSIFIYSNSPTSLFSFWSHLVFIGSRRPNEVEY